MLSKVVSREQALLFGSRLMKGEQLNQSMMKVWSGHQSTVARARAFTGHSQIVTEILHCKGDISYLSDRGGMSFGIRHTFVSDEEGEGVALITLALYRIRSDQ